MGILRYGRSQSHKFHDRTLEHLRVVINSRLGKNEAFMLTWAPNASPGQTVSLCISAAVPIAFVFSETAPVPLSREWVSRLLQASYGPDGLTLRGPIP